MGLLDSLKNLFGGNKSDAAPAAPEMDAPVTPEAPAPEMAAPAPMGGEMGGSMDAAPAAPEAPVEQPPVA
ncbi:hypothetical protein HN803_05705 [candidate division WWE3 bacterium]|jgi:hypothetical protein|nr:hypothetical protein [candidate division WWE3 bacterium]MBT7350255.1 hypothetical protein [candidate division WWE3 bacterium]